MKLHLGSGKVYLDGWLNVDLDAPNADMQLDLREPLPFADDSVDYIFNEHLIEHIERDKALALLKECRRVLRMNGVLRLSTPDLKYLAVSYLARNMDEWGELWMPINPCHMLNEGMRSWGHEFLYDAEELCNVLRESGFSNISFVKWRESSNDELVCLESRPFHNELIIEASSNHITADFTESHSERHNYEPWLNSVHSTMVDRIEHLERKIRDQATCISHAEANLNLCGQRIEELEAKNASQSTLLKSKQIDWEVRGQRIEELELKLASSFRGRITKFVRHLRNRNN